jgi:hypothetical protein
MEKFEWKMLDDGSYTIKGGKDKRIKNEVSQINMLQGINRSLDGKTNYNSCQKRNKSIKIKLFTQ